MKFVATSILMILLFTQTFSKWLVVVEYHINKDFVAKNLCVNKAKLKMHCNGKCQMMKRLAEEEKQNSSKNSNTTKIKIQELVFSNEMSKPILPLLTYVTLSYNQEPPLSKYASPSSSIFHPPALG